MDVLLGIDLGTESARVGLYEFDGQEIKVASESLVTTTIGAGRAIQDPLLWWDALGKASRAALEGTSNVKVAAVCVSTTSSTMVATTMNGIPTYPAIMWMDTRAWRQAHRSMDLSHDILKYSGGYNAAEWLISKAIWLRENEPEIYGKSDYIVEALDYLNYKLSNQWASSLMNSTCKSNLDPVSKSYDSDIFRQLGAQEIEQKFPTEIIAIGHAIGPISDSAALHLGILGNPVLAQGGIDAHIGMLGGGCAQPGKVFMIGGTSSVQLALTSKAVAIPGVWGPYPNVLVDGLHLLEGGQISSGSILRWFTRDILRLSPQGAEDLMHKAQHVDPASNGLLALDYWMGNRSPLRDDLLRGAVIGLSLNNTMEDIYVTLTQGIAFGTKRVLDSYAASGVNSDHIVIAGGIRHNPVWLQMTADVLGKELHLSDCENLTTLSCAISAATAIGIYPTLTSAAEVMKTSVSLILPCEDGRNRHEEKYQMYLELSSTLTPLLHKLSIQSDQSP